MKKAHQLRLKVERSRSAKKMERDDDSGTKSSRSRRRRRALSIPTSAQPADHWVEPAGDAALGFGCCRRRIRKPHGIESSKDARGVGSQQEDDRGLEKVDHLLAQHDVLPCGPYFLIITCLSSQNRRVRNNRDYISPNKYFRAEYGPPRTPGGLATGAGHDASSRTCLALSLAAPSRKPRSVPVDT